MAALTVGSSYMTVLMAGGFDVTALVSIVSTCIANIRVGTEGKCWPSLSPVATQQKVFKLSILIYHSLGEWGPT